MLSGPSAMSRWNNSREKYADQGQLSRIENGKVSSPVSTLTRIAAALGTEPGAFFQMDEAAPEDRRSGTATNR